ncbi:hypothetical protein BST97_14560 [Nonlabens spongiae]|uniref:PA14 domain-containing protein n=1 Tax=Nonlabens spongiae TaxID=331648 RepID=A0A1W6MND6_9FLAO|nr:PA14 domain-containing protein [Nonlabens spongiae]ARN79108.1 hypothetical protein BST97_14560 [Nonlabens spongiae]
MSITTPFLSFRSIRYKGFLSWLFFLLIYYSESSTNLTLNLFSDFNELDNVSPRLLESLQTDTDGDGVVDSVDIDDDGDGILDVDEDSCSGALSGTGSLNYAFFDQRPSGNSVDNIPASGSALATGTVSSFNVANLQSSITPADGNTYSIRYSGVIEIAFGGSYTFFVNSDDGSKLFVDGTEVVDNDGRHPPREESGSITLMAGTYSLEVLYFDDTGGQILEVEYSSSSISRRSLPFSVLGTGTDSTCDGDGDGLVDRLDLDSDNDGIPDNVEAQATVGYVAPSGLDDDGDGLDNAYDATPNGSSDGSGSLGLTPLNTDGSGEADYRDLDSDGDGLFDIGESGLGLVDGNADGRTDGVVGANGLDAAVDTSDDYLDPNGIVDVPSDDLTDSDLDALSGGDVDYRDSVDSAVVLEAVDDSLTVPQGADSTEAINVLDNDTINGSPADIALVDLTQLGTGDPGITLDVSTGALSVSPSVAAGSYVLSYRICQSGSATNCDDAIVSVTVEEDTDGDGVVDSVDIDDDGDGILDVDEDSCSGALSGTGSLNYAFFDQRPSGNSVDNIPASGSALATGTVSSFNVANLQSSITPADGNTYSIRYSGVIEIAFGGSYTFFVNSDDGSKLFVDGTEVVDNDGRHPPREESGSITLMAGTYSLEVLYFDDTGGQILEVEYSSSSISRRSLPFSVLGTGTDSTCDGDGDGLVDRLDLDSDNDGIPDNVEAQATVGYVAPSGLDDDGDGLDNAYDATPNGSSDGSGSLGLTPLNTDGSGEADYRDLDSDGDGLFDIGESGLGLVDGNADGRTDGVVGANGLDAAVDTSDDYLDPNGIVDVPSDDLTDSDLDALSGGDVDYRDSVDSAVVLEAVDDSLTVPQGADSTEAINVLDNDTINGSPADIALVDLTQLGTGDPGITLDVSTGALSVSPSVAAGSYVLSYRICQSGSATNCDDAIVSVTVEEDTDGDGVVDSVDIDDDGDGILDVDEDSCSGALSGTGSLNYAFFDQRPSGNSVDNIPASGSALATGTVSSFNVANLQSSITPADGNTYSIRYSGVIEIAFGGSYTFFVNSDDGSKLFVDGTEVVDNDGRHPPREESGSITLMAGTYSLEVLYFDDTGGQILEVEYSSSSISRRSLPFSVLGTGTDSTCDGDGDGLVDRLDLDSDNDGIPDNVEAQATVGYVAPSGLDDDGDGLDNAYDATPNGSSDGSGSLGLTPLNTDGSGEADYRDLDSDGDGLFDIGESGLGLVDGNADGRTDGVVGANGLDAAVDTSDDYLDPNGIVDVPSDDLTDSDLDALSGGDVDYRDVNNDQDTDGDGVADRLDVDDDNDGILDATEEQCESSTALVSAISDSNIQSGQGGVVQINDGIVSANSGVAMNNVSHYFVIDLGSTLSPGSIIRFDWWTNNGANRQHTITEVSSSSGSASGSNPLIVNYPNSSDQNFYEYSLAGFSRYILVDMTRRSAGRVEILEATITSICNSDSDGDGIVNSLDLDSDNDGIPDNIESQSTVGYIAPSGLDDDGDGLDNAYDATPNGNANGDGSIGITPENTDGTDLPDYLDTDSDNDGLFDIDESGDGLTDSNGDGRTDGVVGNNGLEDTVDDPVAGDGYDDPSGKYDDTQTDNFTDTDGDVLAGGDVDYRDVLDFDVDMPTQTVLENNAFTSVAPTLTNSPGGTITYSLGGVDAADFTIDPVTGVVSMVARDFENPVDDNTNNFYNLTIIATSSVGPVATDDFTVIVNNECEDIDVVQNKLRATDPIGVASSSDNAVLQVEVTDASGAPRSGVQVSISLESGSASFVTASTGTTDASGLFSATVSSTVVGTPTFSARYAATTGAPDTDVELGNPTPVRFLSSIDDREACGEVGIAVSMPHPSSVLEVFSEDKGVLIPSVALLSCSDTSTIPNPATSLLVYNTNASPSLGVGFVFFDGAEWRSICLERDQLRQ